MRETSLIHEPTPPGRAPLTFRPPTVGVQERLSLLLEYWRDGLAYLAAILTPVIAYVGNLGFAPLVSLLGIGALVFLGRKNAPSIGLAILLALLAWALVSMSWSPAMPVHPDFHRYKTVEGLTGVKLVLELGLYASFVFAMRHVSEGAARRASLVLAAALALMTVLLVVEALDGAVLYQWIKAEVHNKARSDLAVRNVARACYVATVLFWPVILRLQRAYLPVVTAVFVLGLGASLALFRLDAPILALILAALVFVGVRQFGRGLIWALIGAVVIYFATAPLVAHFVTGLLHPHELPGQIGKHSWAERLDIWRFVSREVLQNPMKGWGLDASRAWPNDIPLHPHDAALQVWLELGALGAALAGLFWAWLFTRIAALVDEDRTMAAAAAASATAYLTIGALSFGVWQEWWLAVGAVAVVVCGFVATSRQSDGFQGHDLLELQPIV
jgi:O-antigen ligase